MCWRLPDWPLPESRTNTNTIGGILLKFDQTIGMTKIDDLVMPRRLKSKHILEFYMLQHALGHDFGPNHDTA